MKALCLILSLAFSWLCCAQAQPGKQIAKNAPTATEFGPTSVPALELVSCPLPDVLQAASSQARRLVENLQQFSATERIEHSELDKSGKAHSPKSARFAYVAEIHELPNSHTLNVEEYRDGTTSLEGFPTRMATWGLPAFALIFHPLYVEDFSLACDGLTRVQGHAAWQVRFAQRRTNNFRSYNVRQTTYPVKLQGVAWIAVETGDVLRLESQLVDPVPDIQLKQEHVVIDYRSVAFPRHNVQLWLPEMAQITMDFRGHVYRQRHAFSNFQLFWVETGEKRKEPQ